jgi:hypothetical protein
MSVLAAAIVIQAVSRITVAMPQIRQANSSERNGASETISSNHRIHFREFAGRRREEFVWICLDIRSIGFERT